MALINFLSPLCTRLRTQITRSKKKAILKEAVIQQFKKNSKRKNLKYVKYSQTYAEAVKLPLH